jgi:hypothetical protein
MENKNVEVNVTAKAEEIANMFLEEAEMAVNSEVKKDDKKKAIKAKKDDKKKAPEAKKTEIKNDTETKKPEDNLLESEKAYKLIQEKIEKKENLKIVETDNSSGFSYFSGRQRLFKLLRSKRGVSLEINIQLEKEFTKEFPEMEDISIAKAKAKHMGTMKHHYKASDVSKLSKILDKIILTFEDSIKTETKQTKIS